MRHAALGGALFLLSDTLLAFNRFHAPLLAAALWILASYLGRAGFDCQRLAATRGGRSSAGWRYKSVVVALIGLG